MIVAFVGTLLCHLYLVGAFLPGHAHWPALMLSGDQRMFYFPSFMEGYRRFWHGGLLGIDFLVNDGASAFAFRPNEMPFYPPYIIAYLVADCSNPRTAVVALTVVHILHHFAGMFFSFTFVRRYLGLPTASAILATVIYTLGWYTGALATEETFYLQMMLLPVVACALCWLMQTRSRLAPIWVSPVFLTMFLTNYGPTMIAATGLAIVAALLGYGLWLDSPKTRTPRVLIAPLASMALAALVCLPYIVGQLQFKKVMAPTADGIGEVAHDLALSGPDPVNALSQSMDFGRTHFEEFLVWGLIPVFICLFGLYVLIGRRDAIKSSYLWVCGVSAVVYLVVLLPLFGTSLQAASDAFYYGAPILGRMHLYQRSLAFTQFFFAILVSGLATIAVRYASQGAKRWAAFIGIAAWFGVSAALMRWVAAPTDVNSLLLELFLMAIAAVALCVARITPALLVVSLLSSAVGLNVVYTLASNLGRPSIWAIEADPLGPEMNSIIGFVKANQGDKTLPKMALATPEIESYINRNLPWIISKEVKIMNYQGYPPHLANVADYTIEEFGNYGVFDVSWLKDTGLDFLFWKDSKPAQLATFTMAGFQLGPTLDLPGGNHLSKVSLSSTAQSPVKLDLAPGAVAQWPAPLALDLWKVKDGVLVKDKDGKQSQFGYQITPRAGQTYQVDFDAQAASPGQLRVALAGQVLDVIDVAGKAHFSKRLVAVQPGDLWILSTPTFAGSISNLRVQIVTPPAPEATFDNGVFRYDGPRGAIKQFDTNYTTRVRTSIDAPRGGTLTYLLWPNPRMAPYLDGRRAQWANPGDKPVKIEITPGRHTFELRYHSLAGAVFYLTVFLYLLLLAASVAGPYAQPALERYRGRLLKA